MHTFTAVIHTVVPLGTVMFVVVKENTAVTCCFTRKFMSPLRVIFFVSVTFTFHFRVGDISLRPLYIRFQDEHCVPLTSARTIMQPTQFTACHYYSNHYEPCLKS